MRVSLFVGAMRSLGGLDAPNKDSYITDYFLSLCDDVLFINFRVAVKN